MPIRCMRISSSLSASGDRRRRARPCACYLRIPALCWHNRPGKPAASSGGRDRRSRNKSRPGSSLGRSASTIRRHHPRVIMDLSKLARHPGLKGRSVLVTGGGSGIGAAIVEGFVDQGAKVTFVDIDETKSQKSVGELKAQYGTAPTFAR